MKILANPTTQRSKTHPYLWCVLQNLGHGIRGGPQTKMSGWYSLSSFFTPSELPLCPASVQAENAFPAASRENPSTINVEGVGVGYPRNHAELVMLIGAGRWYAGPSIFDAQASPLLPYCIS